MSDPLLDSHYPAQGLAHKMCSVRFTKPMDVLQVLSSEATHNMAMLSAPEEPSDCNCVTMLLVLLGQSP